MGKSTAHNHYLRVIKMNVRYGKSPLPRFRRIPAVGFEDFVLSVPPYLSSTPGGFGIHLGEGDCTLPLIGFSATPPSLWPGRELRKFHHYVRGNEYSVFKVRFTVSGFPPHLGCCPCCDHSVSES